MKALLCKRCINNATEKSLKVGEKAEQGKKCYWCDETEVTLFKCTYDEDEELSFVAEREE